MLSSIKNLQVIVHLGLFGFVVPASAQIFMAQLSELIAFDPVDLGEDFGIEISLSEDKNFELESNF